MFALKQDLIIWFVDIMRQTLKLKQGSQMTATRLEATTTYLVRKLTLNYFIECGFTLKRVRDMMKTYSQGNQMFLILYHCF